MLAQCFDLDVRLYYAADQDLVSGVGTFHIPLLKAATYHRYIMPNMCRNPSICPSSFPQVYNATPFKWLKLFNRSTFSSVLRGSPEHGLRMWECSTDHCSKQ